MVILMVRPIYQPMASIRLTAVVLSAFVALITCFRLASAVEMVTLLPIEAPTLQDSKITYNFNFQFSHCGDDYWCFYDSTSMRLVIEFYDVMILAQDSLSLNKSMPVKTSIRCL